jgi:DNA invertase Pin-like site-specific DNA recombinase
LGLEVSRLARNNADWHRLLEICALTDTLILDEDGSYDPSHFNDRLLLGLKGAMSEAELHVLRARLQGGIHNKARRGELIIKPPVGLVYNSEGVLVLDPDKQVQQSLRLLFETFRRTGSATATVKVFRKQGLLFPRRVSGGPQKGDLVWGALGHCQVLRILHNPRYAGAFVFGRHHSRKTVDGRSRIVPVPREEWETLIPGAHASYLSWEDYEQNQKRLHESAQAMGSDRRKSPAREGPALLQGLIVCGRCGDRMTVRYHVRHGRLCPDYLCQREGVEHAQPMCQQVPGSGIDEAISTLLIEAVSPVALEVALSVQQELQSRLEEADSLRLKQVERAQYEADLARRRYMRVEPEHRLVADSLEAEWNSKLRALAETQHERERHRQQDRQALSDQQREAILALSADFPRLWRDPNTPDRERKRMTRLLLEDVTVLRSDMIVLQIRFKGGAARTLTLPLPPNAWQQRATNPEVVRDIDRMLEDNTDGQIAAILNERGIRSGEGKRFSRTIVARIRRDYSLAPRYDRLRAAGMLTVQEMAAVLGVTPDCIKIWNRHGLLHGHAYNDRNECLYEAPVDNPPHKAQGHKPSERGAGKEATSISAKEVQCEA